MTIMMEMGNGNPPTAQWPPATLALATKRGSPFLSWPVFSKKTKYYLLETRLCHIVNLYGSVGKATTPRFHPVQVVALAILNHISTTMFDPDPNENFSISQLESVD